LIKRKGGYQNVGDVIDDIVEQFARPVRQNIFDFELARDGTIDRNARKDPDAVNRWTENALACGAVTFLALSFPVSLVFTLSAIPFCRRAISAEDTAILFQSYSGLTLGSSGHVHQTN
jgi:hypothetical protein